jgi:GDP-mannose 6-dehydrogenase
VRISVFGLGYVGTVSAACFARDGHEVVGVDPNPTKVEMIRSGQTPVIEPGLRELVGDAVRRGRLRATGDAVEAVHRSDLSLICVGTPSEPNGSLDLRAVRAVSEEIGGALATVRGRHAVVLRSTVLPGTTRRVVVPALEAASGKTAGRDFGVCVNPEFLREGTAVRDFDNPPKTVIGYNDESSGDLVAELYEAIDAPLIRLDVATAEMVKYADNAWHALKVGFANEVGNVAKLLGLDSHRVMAVFCQDTKLNLSPAYLKPGAPFGGSCLPKDLRALTYLARSLDLEVPILASILPSNRLQVEKALQMVLNTGKRRVGVLGLSFKAGTDDLRESPLVELVERLIGKGLELRIYDRNVHLASLTGANREFILNRIPHISRLMVPSLEEAIQDAEVVLVGNNDGEFKAGLADQRPGRIVLDLVRIAGDRKSDGTYEGICW